MYDNNLSHKNQEIISDIVNKVKKHFGYQFVVRVKYHTLLGVVIEIKYNIIKLIWSNSLRSY